MTSIRRLMGLALATAMGTHAAVGAAPGNAPSRSGPPLEYRIDEVSITIGTYTPTQRAGWRSIQMMAGASWAETQSRTRKTFDFSRAQMMDALNALYAMRFFDLPTDLAVRRSVRLDDDGIVRTSMLRMQDTGATRVCVRTPSYEKCVSYAEDAPEPLLHWVKQTRGDALRAAQIE